MSFSRYLSKLGQLLNSSGQVLPSGLATGTDFTIAGLTVGKGAGSVSTNTAVGASALAANTSGSVSVAVGASALEANTSGANNTAVGYRAGYTNQTGSYNTFIGNNAGKVATGSANSFIGSLAGFATTTGTENVAFGTSASASSALQSNTTGSYNTALGNGSLGSNTTASNNTAVGYQAGYSKTTGNRNSLFGHQAMFNATTAEANTVIGHTAGGNISTGSNNTLVGGRSDSGTNEGAGFGLTTGGYNNFFGGNAGSSITTGSKNTVLGNYSGNQGGLDIRTASNYIVLSDGDGNPRAYWDGASATFNGPLALNAASSTSLSLRNSNVNGGSSSGITGIYLGDNGSGVNLIERSKTSINTTQLRLYTEHGYNVQVLWAYGYNTAAYQGNNSTAWSTTSDQRVKTNIRQISGALEKICALNAVHFEYKNALGKTKTSFLAQEFEQVLPGHVHETPAPDDLKEYVGEDGMMKALDPDLIPYLVAAIQELKAEFDAYKASHP
jgi:hypothetical protein